MSSPTPVVTTSSVVEPGPIHPIALNNADTFSSQLVTPAAVSSTPLGQALAGLDQSFGDPSQGEFVILLSDGSETCGATSDAVDQAMLLASRGPRYSRWAWGPATINPCSRALRLQAAASSGRRAGPAGCIGCSSI